METLDHEDHRVWLHFLPPYAKKEKDICNLFSFCWQRESNSAHLHSKQVSAPLSITPFPLGSWAFGKCWVRRYFLQATVIQGITSAIRTRYCLPRSRKWATESRFPPKWPIRASIIHHLRKQLLQSSQANEKVARSSREEWPLFTESKVHLSSRLWRLRLSQNREDPWI